MLKYLDFGSFSSGTSLQVMQWIGSQGFLVRLGPGNADRNDSRDAELGCNDDCVAINHTSARKQALTYI